MRLMAAGLLVTVCLNQAVAEIKIQAVQSSDGDVVLECFVAGDSAKVSTPVPGVLVVHQWLGLSDYEKSRCRQLPGRLRRKFWSATEQMTRSSL